jgi:hypothetical protein
MTVLWGIFTTTEWIVVQLKVVPTVTLTVGTPMHPFGSGIGFGEIDEGVGVIDGQKVVVCHTR